MIFAPVTNHLLYCNFCLMTKQKSKNLTYMKMTTASMWAALTEASCDHWPSYTWREGTVDLTITEQLSRSSQSYSTVQSSHMQETAQHYFPDKYCDHSKFYADGTVTLFRISKYCYDLLSALGPQPKIRGNRKSPTSQLAIYPTLKFKLIRIHLRST